MKKKRITILVAVFLFGVFVLCIPLFHKDENSTGVNQQGTSTTETSEQEGSTEKDASEDTGISNQGDAVEEADVKDIDKQIEAEAPSKQDLDNEAEIPENWGE